MRLVLATLSMLLGAAMLLPAGTALPVFAQVAPSASVEPSGSPLPDAVVELSKHTELDPAGDWAITVTGGNPSVDAVTIPDSQCCGDFTVTVFGESATVEMTAILAAGSRLTSGTCRRDGDYPDEEALVAPDRLVLEVVAGGAYECSYGSEAPDTDQSSAEIVAQTIIDADGNLDTVDDQTGGEGWEFELEMADGTIDEAFPTTNSEGLAGWLISFGPDGTSATLTEVVQGGFALLDASCMKIADSGDEPVGEFDGDSITFQIEEGAFATYQCSFVNVRSDISLAGIEVWKHIDADGDLATSDDHQWPPSWEFEVEFEDGIETVFADPVTHRDEPAVWVIGLAGDSDSVVVTEVPRDGYRLFEASCIDADSSDGAEIPTTLEGNSLSFDVSGFRPVLELGAHPYWCNFYNTPVGGAALPTVPPTHAASDPAVVASAPWHLVLVGLAALIASLLLLGSRRAAPRRQ